MFDDWLNVLMMSSQNLNYDIVKTLRIHPLITYWDDKEHFDDTLKMITQT